MTAALLSVLEAIIQILIDHLRLSRSERTKLIVRMHNLKEAVHPEPAGDQDGDH